MNIFDSNESMGGKAVHSNQLLIAVVPLDTLFLDSLMLLLKTVYLEVTLLKGLPFA